MLNQSNKIAVISVLQWSSLFYNTSARHERRECNTNDTSPIRGQHEQHECNMSETGATWVPHECNTNDMSVARVKNFDFDNDTSENIFSHPILAIWQMKDYKERTNFILRTTFWKCLVTMPKPIWKVHHKNLTL